MPSQRVTIPGHRSTGAVHPHTFHCGIWAATHHRNLGTREGHFRVILPCEHGVMVGMMKQSQCLHLERSKENIPIPAGRAGTAQWLLQHHLMWSSAMSTIPKALPTDTRIGKASGEIPAGARCCG